MGCRFVLALTFSGAWAQNTAQVNVDPGARISVRAGGVLTIGAMPPPVMPPPASPPALPPTTMLTMGAAGESCTTTCAGRSDGRTSCVLGAYSDNTDSWVPSLADPSAWNTAVAAADNNDARVALFVLAGYTSAAAHLQQGGNSQANCGQARPFLDTANLFSGFPVQKNFMYYQITDSTCMAGTTPTCDGTIAGGRRICLCGN